MKHIVESTKNIEQLMQDLQESVKAHQFGVLNIHDLKNTLHKKGFELSQPCYILDVCNPKQALRVLEQDMSMNVALPCRISVYQDQGKTLMATIKPSAMLSMLSDAPELKQVAEEVEATIVRIMDDAK